MSVSRKRKEREIIVISSDEDDPVSRHAPKHQRSNWGTNVPSRAPSTVTVPPVDMRVSHVETLIEQLPSQQLLDARLQAPEELSRLEPKDPCLAVCSGCVPEQHLQRCNRSFYFCQRCRAPYLISRHPCRCRKYRLGEPQEPKEPEAHSEELRAAVEASGLSKFAQRVLLLVSQVPAGRYTTITALKDWYIENHNLTSKSNIASALRRNVLAPYVPCHRVVVSNGGFGMLDHGDHGEDWEVRMEMLAEEGVRFDKNGRLLGSTFTSLTGYNHTSQHVIVSLQVL